MLVLSIFPGIDLLGKGFEKEGFSVVRGPDLIFGGDICKFHVPPNKFDGVIGGPPCQDFSGKRRTPPTGNGVYMLKQFARVVTEARPLWFLLENVPAVPDVVIAGYSHQRIDVRASDFGLPQRRLRHFQFGSREDRVLVFDRSPTVTVTEPAALASGRTHSFSKLCQLQGLPADYTLPSFTKAGARRAVGNGVPVPMAAALAAAIKSSPLADDVTVCACSCGRAVTGKQTYATAACRKRAQRKRDAAAVSNPGIVTAAKSHIVQTRLFTGLACHLWRNHDISLGNRRNG